MNEDLIRKVMGMSEHAEFLRHMADLQDDGHSIIADQRHFRAAADHIARLEARVAELEEKQKFGFIAEPVAGKMLPVEDDPAIPDNGDRDHPCFVKPSIQAARDCIGDGWYRCGECGRKTAGDPAIPDSSPCVACGGSGGWHMRSTGCPACHGSGKEGDHA